jgi:3',5'-cyclic AMP phosphodiesterase CpdA
MAAFTLAQLSDPHLPPLPAPRLADLAGKRALGYLNWTRNRRRFHQRDVLDALVSDIRAQRPDHIAVTGDLVNLALEAEFAPALAWLQSGGDDAADGVAFPSLRRRGPLALIGLSSAVPTPPLMATGWLGRRQLAALELMLTRLSGEEAFRVLLIHHPLRSDSRFKQLTDAPELLALLRQHGVELVLHGHDHVHSTIWIDGPNGAIPAIGVPSASAVAHGHYPAAAYNLFSIERDGAAWRCEQTIRGFEDGANIRQLQRTRLM